MVTTEIIPNEANVASESRSLATERKRSCPDKSGLENTEKKEEKVVIGASILIVFQMWIQFFINGPGSALA